MSHPGRSDGRRAAIFAALLGLTAVLFVLGFNRFIPVPFGVIGGAATLASCIVVVVVLFLAALYRTAGFLVVGILFNFAVLQRYVVSLGIPEPNDLVTNLMETDLRELSGFVDGSVLAGFGLTTLAACAVVWALSAYVPLRLIRFLRERRRTLRRAAAGLTALLLLTGMFLPKPPMEESQERVIQAAGWPLVPLFQALRTIKGYYFGEQQFSRLIDGLPSAAKLPSSFASSDQGLTVVFVFGESLRADHWGLNGYQRDTTPLLSREPGVINFTHAISFGIYTQASAVGMLTPATFAQPRPAAGSFVDLFVQHGFDASALISARPTAMQLRLIEGIKKRTMQRGLAMDLLAPLRAQLAASKAANQFMFVYTEGNHFPYNRGYSPEFARFKPDDHGRANLGGEIDKLVNAYDDAILYTDSFLAQIIDSLRDRRAFLVYMADHGDALGDEGNFIRGGSMTSPYLRRVPMMIWVSPAYEQSDPEKVRWLRSHTDLHVAHQNLFPTVLGMAGIHSPLVDETRDLSGPRALPRTFEIQDGVPPGSPFHGAH